MRSSYKGEEMPLLFNVARMYNCDQTIYRIQGKCGDSDTCKNTAVSCECKIINDILNNMNEYYFRVSPHRQQAT